MATTNPNRKPRPGTNANPGQRQMINEWMEQAGATRQAAAEAARGARAAYLEELRRMVAEQQAAYRQDRAGAQAAWRAPEAVEVPQPKATRVSPRRPAASPRPAAQPEPVRADGVEAKLAQLARQVETLAQQTLAQQTSAQQTLNPQSVAPPVERRPVETQPAEESLTQLHERLTRAGRGVAPDAAGSGSAGISQIHDSLRAIRDNLAALSRKPR
jgi:hypothetical protein